MIKPYIELLKKSLTFLLWDKGYLSIDYVDYSYSRLKRIIVFFAKKVFEKFDYKIMREQSPSPQAHTMIPLTALDNIESCFEDVIRTNVKGDFVEAGVWRGGACIFMRGLLKAYGITDRKVFVADSFQGLPKPEWEEDNGDKHHTYKYLEVSLEEVKNNFKKYDLLDSQVVFLKGWFKDTLQTPQIEKLAILRLDGDMYGSTMETLIALYPKLSKGGYCIIDDWNLPNAKKAVVKYRTKNNITDKIKVIPYNTSGVHGQSVYSVYWKKL